MSIGAIDSKVGGLTEIAEWAREQAAKSITPRTELLSMGGFLGDYAETIRGMKDLPNISKDIKQLVEAAIKLEENSKLGLPFWTHLKNAIGIFDEAKRIQLVREIATQLGFSYDDFVNGKVPTPVPPKHE